MLRLCKVLRKLPGETFMRKFWWNRCVLYSFVRIERGGFRNRDVRDIAPENNTVSHVVPQLIASTPVELERLAALFTEKGYKEADFNMGCPFPLVARKHKGSGILPYPAEVEALLKELTHYPELSFRLR